MTASSYRRIAVLDIGKTNAKVVVLDSETGAEIAVLKRPNVTIKTGPYPHYDIEALWSFALDALKKLAREPGFDAISITRGVPEQSWLNASGDEVLTTARLVREEHLGRVVGIAVGLRSGRGRARLDRERSDLVATVAHELRSPLTGVKGFVQALLNRWDKLTDDQRKLMLTTVNADADLGRWLTGRYAIPAVEEDAEERSEKERD